MKQEFNNSIILTDMDGNKIPFLKKSIATIRAADSANEEECSIITLRDQREIEVMEGLKYILKLMSGDPTLEQVKEFERQVIAERQQRAEREMAELRAIREREQSESAERLEGRQRILTAEIADIRHIDDVTRQAIADHLLFKMAFGILKSTRDSRFETVRDAGHAVSEFLAGKKYMPQIAALFTTQERVDAKEAAIVRAQEERAQTERREEERFRREMGRLESQRTDPEMRREDRLILERLIHEHRVSHAEPDFKFIRDPKARDTYRPEHEIRAERDRERDIGREQGREPFARDALDDLHSRAIGRARRLERDHPSRGLGRSRDRGYDMER